MTKQNDEMREETTKVEAEAGATREAVGREALSRELGVEIYRLEKLRDKGLPGLDVALMEREGHSDPIDETIVTEAPNLMWRTDGTKVFTLEDRWVRVFATVEHWNAECVGWQGGRYAALEPISQGLTSLHGSVAADLARGLRLRMDHCSQYLSDHFVNQDRFWGITPSFAFVEQPQTKGVVERFI